MNVVNESFMLYLLNKSLVCGKCCNVNAAHQPRHMLITSVNALSSSSLMWRKKESGYQIIVTFGDVGSLIARPSVICGKGVHIARHLGVLYGVNICRPWFFLPQQIQWLQFCSSRSESDLELSWRALETCHLGWWLWENHAPVLCYKNLGRNRVAESLVLRTIY